MRTALEDARVRPVFSAEPCGHRVRVRGTESVTDCNATEAEPGRHQCLPLRDLKFPPSVTDSSISFTRKITRIPIPVES